MSKYAAIAAGEGNLEVLRWLHEKGCKLGKNVCKEAAANGHLDVLRWLRDREADLDCAANAACANGHLEVLRWLEGEGVRPSKKAFLDAAKGGHLEVLRWSVDLLKQWDLMRSVSQRAAGGGNLEILKWLHSMAKEAASKYKKEDPDYGPRNDWDGVYSSYICASKALTAAAEHGHLDIMKWLWKMYKIKRTVAAVRAAAANGNIPVLTWLKVNGWEWGKALEIVTERGHVDTALWIKSIHTDSKYMCQVPHCLNLEYYMDDRGSVRALAYKSTWCPDHEKEILGALSAHMGPDESAEVVSMLRSR